jgi:hypothetical protein
MTQPRRFPPLRYRLVTAFLAVTLSAGGAPGGSGVTEEVTAQARRTVEAAIDLLTAAWTAEYARTNRSTTGYLEIKNTRLIEIKDDLTGVTGADSFEGVDYVVEFILYSDYFSTAPYYINPTVKDSVTCDDSGDCEVNDRNPFLAWQARTFGQPADLAASIRDFGPAFNVTFDLA